MTGEHAGEPPFVTVVVPTLDEESHVEACLQSLLPQWPPSHCEVLVVDGGSSDRTVEVVASVARRHPSPHHPPVRVLHNPHRVQSAAVNLAARCCSPRTQVLLRADAHAVYPGDFVRSVVDDLLRTGAGSVVVGLHTVADPNRGVQRAIAAAQRSRLGNGGARHRVVPREGPVDHGHHAAFDLDWFRRLGGYDPTFTHNEDAEFDHRARAAGGTVWMSATAVQYTPRATLRALAGQYLRHGAGRARTLRKHRLRPAPRQVAPLVLVLGQLAVAAGGRFAPRPAAVLGLHGSQAAGPLAARRGARARRDAPVLGRRLRTGSRAATCP
jgi:succinoglycan biosynthesis protein ExoA